MSWFGYVGTLKAPPFQILHPVDAVAGRHRFDEWALCCTFLGEDGVPRYGGTDPEAADRLKAEAERWLEEFAASSGAVFPGEPGEPAAFQVSEARDTLALWDRNQAGEPVTSRERVLADQVRALLAIVSPHCTCPCKCPAPGQRDDDGTPGWCDSCRMNIHAADRDTTPGAAGTETTDG